MLIKKIDYCIKPLVGLIAACALTLPVNAETLTKLDKVHQKIISTYSNVEHIEDLPSSATNSDDIVLIDVREADEFEVSRIQGAIRVSPDISDKEFLDRFGSNAEDKTYIFYCSVGRRSSELISRVQEGLLSEGAESIRNLEGGLFKWHNENKHLINQHGGTQFVHPYNFWWKRLLDRPNESSYAPH